MSFSVRVEGIRFSAGHFATYAGGCEPLHGHTYEVAAEVRGALTDDSWVLDFSTLKSVLRLLCGRLDHRFLLQRKSRHLQITREGGEWQVTTPAGARYVFPSADVADLPLDNSTAERLAEYLGGEMAAALADQGISGIEQFTVEVWEGPGQVGRFTRNGPPKALD